VPALAHGAARSVPDLGKVAHREPWTRTDKLTALGVATAIGLPVVVGVLLTYVEVVKQSSRLDTLEKRLERLEDRFNNKFGSDPTPPTSSGTILPVPEPPPHSSNCQYRISPECPVYAPSSGNNNEVLDMCGRISGERLEFLVAWHKQQPFPGTVAIHLLGAGPDYGDGSCPSMLALGPTTELTVISGELGTTVRTTFDLVDRYGTFSYCALGRTGPVTSADNQLLSRRVLVTRQCSDLARCTYYGDWAPPDYTCPGSIVMSGSGNIDQSGAVAIAAHKNDFTPFQPGEYFVSVFDPNDGDPSNHCQSFNVTKSRVQLTEPTADLRFPAFSAELACGGIEKAYCVMKSDSGIRNQWCSDMLVVGTQ